MINLASSDKRRRGLFASHAPGRTARAEIQVLEFSSSELGRVGDQPPGGDRAARVAAAKR